MASTESHISGITRRRIASGWLLACVLITTVTTPASADDAILLLSTESPRATLQSFLHLRDDGNWGRFLLSHRGQAHPRALMVRK